jgi:predicted permease
MSADGTKAGRGISSRLSVSEDVERELRAHLEMRAEELETQGWDRSSAREEAARRFGDQERVARECRAVTKSHHRAVGRARSMEAIWQDLKYAVRSLTRSPAFAVVAIITLALGIGANTAIFSVVNGVLLRPLPFDRPEQLVWAAELRQQGGPMPVAWPNFRDWREETRSFDHMTAYGRRTTTLLGGAEPAWASLAVVSQDFWSVFPVSPVAGRLTNPGDHREGAAPVAVVGQSFARDVLGGANVVGRVVEVLGMSVEVVGVLPDSFEWPTGVQVWAPLELSPQGESRSAHNWSVVGRLRGGVTAAEAGLELDPLTRRLVGAGSTDEAAYLAAGAIVTPLQEQVVGDSRRSLYILLGAAAFVLLVACTNLASTLLARGTVRRREISVRSALGAGRARLVRQLLAESVVLAGGGAVAGVGLSALVLSALRSFGAASVPRLDVVRMDTTVLLFTLVLAIATVVAFGLLPALRSTAESTADHLRAGSRGNASFRRTTWNALVSTEVALALVLLVGSGLLIRSFMAVLGEEAGFDGSDVALTTVALSGVKYPDLEAHRLFWDDMLDRARAIPGVTGAAVVSNRPLSGAPNGRISLDGDPEKHGDALYVVASSEAFDVLDVPLLRGRFFDERDGPGAPHAVVVSESFADEYWPDGDALGKLVSGGGMDDFWDSDPVAFGTVVGVVGEVRYRDLTRAGGPTVYWNYRQRPFRLRFGGNLLVESASGDPALVGAALRSAVRQTDSDIAVRMRYMSDLITDSVSERRFILLVLGGFAALGLLLASVGIYGVVSYAVARRTREMGIRLALGAAPASVRGLVLGGALRPVLLGLFFGVLGGLALTGVMRGMLYEVEATDPITYVAVVTLLLATGGLASWIPAIRSTRVDPMITMRVE